MRTGKSEYTQDEIKGMGLEAMTRRRSCLLHPWFSLLPKIILLRVKRIGSPAQQEKQREYQNLKCAAAAPKQSTAETLFN